MSTKRDAIDETKRHLERADESAKRTGDKELVRKVDDAHEHIKKRIDPQAPLAPAKDTACTGYGDEYPITWQPRGP